VSSSTAPPPPELIGGAAVTVSVTELGADDPAAFEQKSEYV